MIDNNNALVGKRLSFHELFSDNNFVVEVPTIQRDYAQGRKNKGEVRDLFLQALYDYLDENKPERDLDFVYGSTEVVDGVTKFIPLDGQQRLTTLFLLHWYLAARSNNAESFKELMLLNNKSRFTYLTRPSSSEFVDALVINKVDLDNLLVLTDNQDNNLSETIKDKGWYYLSWSYDPTIQSMLTMLDAIHNKFGDKADFYDRLINLKAPIITFQYLNLKEFSLTEDLYIKMNSRGKPLTSFENFKAKLEQHITLLFGEREKPFVISRKKIKASCREYFSFQIDTVWAKLFWQYKHLVGKPYTFDEELMNFIRVIIANQYAIENSQNLAAFKELVKNESATAELTENISFYKFKSLDALTKNCITYLIDSFDALVNEDKTIKNHLPDKFYLNEDEIFEKALKYNLSLSERALFHAYVRYLIIHKTDRKNFYQWMRVVHNLVENTRIEDADQLINAIKSIEKLLLHSGNILEYLGSSKCRVDSFASWQVEEEIIKAHLIVKSVAWQKTIEQFEKAVFHKGQLGYLFEFSEVLAYYNKHKNCNWNIGEDKLYLASFNSYASRSVALFNFYESTLNKGYLLERALLTKGDYLIPASNNRYNFCSSKHVSNYQRDYSWKRLLRFTVEDIDYWRNKRSYVKELLNDSKLNVLDIRDSLIKICGDLPHDWRAYFIKNNELLKYCGQGFVRIVNGDEIELYYASQQNHYHIDMYSYNLYLTHLKNKIELYEPFQIPNAIQVKNSEEYSYAELEGWCFKKKHYCIKIYRVKGKYVIEFEKAKGNKNQTEFSPEIVDVLLARKFEWDEEDIAYYIRTSKEDTVISLLKKLCLDLKSLEDE